MVINIVLICMAKGRTGLDCAQNIPACSHGARAFPATPSSDRGPKDRVVVVLQAQPLYREHPASAGGGTAHSECTTVPSVLELNLFLKDLV